MPHCQSSTQRIKKKKIKKDRPLADNVGVALAHKCTVGLKERNLVDNTIQYTP